MYNAYVSSTLSLRCKGSVSFSFNDYSYFLNDRFDRNPLLSCCACCANSLYRVPISPSFLYGLRQSTLIQWSNSRRLILGGGDRYYHRLPVNDSGRSCHCGYEFPVKERSVSGRRGRWGEGRLRCIVSEEKSKKHHSYRVNDAEAMLSLLTEEVGEVSFGVRKRNGSSSARRVEVEKRGNGSGTSYHNKKKNVGSGLLESNLKCEFESVRAELREEDYRKKENKENYLRGEKHRLRKEGSSCSSYYSCCSLGEFESATDVQVRQEGYGGESRSGFKRNSVESGEVTYEGEIVEDVKRHGDVAGRHGVVTRQENTPVGLYAESSGVECDWRKKSEKKLTEVSIEQTESSEESLQKHARLSEVHKTGYRKPSSSHKQFDDKEEKSSLAVCIDGGTRQQYSKKGDQIAGQSESRMKYKLSTGMQHIHGSDIEAISSSEKWFSGREENLSAAGSLVQETKQERTKTAGLISRKDDHRINSQQLNEVSEIQEIKVKGTSSSRGQSEARVKNQEDESTLTLSAVQNKEEQIHLTGRWDSRQMDSGRKSLQLTEISGMHHTHIDNSSASLRQSDTRMKNQEDNSNLIFGSFAEVDEQQFQTGQKAIRRVESRKGSQDVSNVSVVHNRDTQVSNTKVASDAIHTHAELNTLALQHRTYGEARRGGTYEEPLNLISQEDALGSADRLQKSSMHFVGEFVEKVTHEVSTSRIQKENRVSETELVNEGHEHQQKSSSQYGSGDFKSKEPDARHLSRSSGVKGPSDEIWDVTDPSIQEPAQTEVIESSSPTANTAAKRFGRSLWNIISEIVQLRWASHSESHSSTRKSGGRSLPNQSASSEAWFSGHEPDESKDEIMKREKKGISQDSKSADQQHSVTIPIHSQGEGSSSVSSKYKIGHLGGDTLSSSSSSASKGISSVSSEENFGRNETGKKHVSTSNTAIVESSVEMPSLRIRRSPHVYEIPEAGNADVSASGSLVRKEQPIGAGLTQISGTGKDGELKQRKILRSNKILKDRFDEWEEAYKLESEQRKIDEIFMREALVEAKKAADIWEVPVGAVLVQHGKIIARGCNLVEELRDATAHAEMICIREASNLLHTWRLSETTLYVTLEPCPMCAGAILQARIDTVVWGAPNKLLGADGSWIRLFPNGGEGGNGLESSDKPTAPVHPFHPNITTRRGVLAAECADKMQKFFQLRRKKEKEPASPTAPSSLPVSNHPSKFLTKIHDAFHIMFCL